MAENKKIRIGNDIHIEWTLLDGASQPYILTGRDISIEVVIGMKKARIKEFSVNENVVSFTYFGKDQKYTGNCDLKFIENDGEREMVTFDIQSAFALVSHSWEAVDAGETPETIQLEFVTVTSELVERVGPKGDTGDPASFGEVTAEVDGNVGTPSVSVETSGPDTAKNFHFTFRNLKGNKGDKGDTPVLTADDDGTIYADGEVLTEVIKEAKETADDDHTRAESDSENAHLDSERASDDHDTAVNDHERYIDDHNTAASDHTTATTDHTRAGQDHTQAASDHTQAASDHDTATSDHTTATADHTRAGQDHTQALSDHDTADSDHFLAVEDHEMAAADHTQAVSDHDTATSDHTTASSDHTTAASDHTQAETDHSTAGTDHTRAESDHSTASDDRSTAASDHSRAESDHERAEDDHESIADKADVDGWYSGMTVGLAENLIDTRGEGTDQEFLFRQACGDKAITDKGNALIQIIYGKTVAWNQLAEVRATAAEVYGITRIKIDDNTIHYSGTSTQTTGFTGTKLTIKVIQGHLYYVAAYGNIPSGVTLTCSTGLILTGNNTRQIVAGTANTEASSLGLNIPAGTSIDTDVHFICVDLTLLTGITTVAEFEKFYNRPYYAFNAGTLLNNKAAAIESTGFNQWDEVVELGTLNNQGQNVDTYSDRLRSKNYIPCLPGTNYYFKSSTIGLFFYDANKAFISSTSASNAIKQTPANARYMRFYLLSSYGTTYNHDICINISDTSRNGEYQPYHKTTLHLDLTTLTGKLNGEGVSVVIAPRGLEGAVAAFDKGLVENGYYSKVQKEVGHVVYDGTEDWKMTSGAFYLANAARKSGKLNIICSKYVTTTSSTETVSSLPDKMIMGANDSGRIYIKDSGCADASAFKAYLAAQYQAGTPLEMNFELDTPQVYVLDTPVPVTYAVENGGTERILPDGVDEQGVPATAPFNAKILYSTNFPREIANLPQNYISKESAVNLLEAFKSAGVISAYTMTFVNGVYTFTITA